MTNRRRVLSAFVPTVAFSGCLGIGQSGYSFNWIGVTNAHYEPHDVSFEIRSDDETVYERRVSVPSISYGDDGGRDPGDGNLTGYPTDPGRYTLRTTVDGVDRWQTVGPESFDGGRSYNVRIYITPDEGHIGFAIDEADVTPSRQ